MARIITFFDRFKDIIFLFLLSLVPLIWYGTGNKLIASHDVGYPLNPATVLKNYVFSWTSSSDFGVSQISSSGVTFYQSIETFLTFLARSLFIGQRIYAVSWFFLPMLVLYLVLKRIKVFADKPYLVLLAAVLFQFNHFQMQGWGVFWQTRFSAYMLLPLTLILMVEYFEGKRKILPTAALFGLFVFFLNGGGSPPVFGSVMIMIIGVAVYYLVLALAKNFGQQLLKTFLFLFWAGLLGFLTSAFWTVTYFYFSFLSYGNIIESIGGPTAVLGWADAVSANSSILNLLRLQGISDWIMPYVPFYAKIFLTNPIFIVAGFLWPILAFSALIFVRKPEEKKYVLLFAFLALIAIIFSAGSHEPFRSFYIFSLKNIPTFPMFRTPFYKFANLLWFSYAVLVSFTLSSIIEKTQFIARLKQLSFKKVSRILVIVFLLGIFIWDHPHITGVFFNYNRDVGLTTMEKIPEYVFAAGRFFDQINNQKTRTFVVPEVNKMWAVEIYKWGYFSGTTVNSFLTSKDFVSNDGSMLAYKEEQGIVNGLYELLRQDDKRWLNIMRMLGIDSVLLRNDSYYDLPGAPSTNPSVYKQVLNQTPELKKTKTIGEWDYYQLQKPVVDKMYLPKNIVYTTFDSDGSLNLLLFLDSIGVNINNNFLSLADKVRNYLGQDGNIAVTPLPMTYLLPEEQQEFSLFQPRILPNSPFYFLVAAREKELEQKTNGPKKLVDLYLGFSFKRLAELNGLLKTQGDLQEERNILDKFGQSLSDARKQTDLFSNQTDKEQAMMRSSEFIARERNFLAQLINKEKNPFTKTALENTYKMSGDIMRSLSLEPDNNIPELEKDYNDPTVVVLTSKYQWEVPETGTYGIYLNNASILANAQELLINIDGKTVNSKQITDNNKQETKIDNNTSSAWQKIGEVDLEKGKHGLKVAADNIPIYSFKKGDLVFYKTDSNKQMKDNPSTSLRAGSKQNLVYTKLNPTRYKVEVSSDGQPLILVFNERFDKDWKVYFADNSEQITDNKEQKTNILNKIWQVLEENIFNTLKLKPLDEKNHFKANGYANAWYIKPTENRKWKMEKGKEYELIIEYWPQRLLWLGYSVSIISVLGAVAYLVIRRKKE